MSEQQTPIPAATLVLFRERGGKPPELLMVERAKAMVFAGGAWVFPGGRVDPADHALALDIGGAPVDTAGRIAAIRETLEEVGLPIGIVPTPDAATLQTLRAALHAGTPFGRALADVGLTLDVSVLTPFSRWLPAHAHMRIFDTLFYLAHVPGDAPKAKIDATENVRLNWASAQRVLDDADAGKTTIIFPTRRNLERLARFSSFDDAVADATAHPIRAVTPWVERRDGVDHLCIPNDLGYPITSEVLTGALRG